MYHNFSKTKMMVFVLKYHSDFMKWWPEKDCAAIK